LIEAKKKEQAQKEKEEAEKRAKKEPTGSVEEITEEEAEAFEREQREKEEAAKKASEAPVATPAEEATPEEEEDEEDKGKIIPINNGAKFDHYEYTQTLQDLTVSFYIPEGVKAKNLDIVITAKRMKVAIKGQAPILEGEWNKTIKTEDTLWTIEDVDGRRVV